MRSIERFAGKNVKVSQKRQLFEVELLLEEESVVYTLGGFVECLMTVLVQKLISG